MRMYAHVCDCWLVATVDLHLSAHHTLASEILIARVQLSLDFPSRGGACSAVHECVPVALWY